MKITKYEKNSKTYYRLRFTIDGKQKEFSAKTKKDVEKKYNDFIKNGTKIKTNYSDMYVTNAIENWFYELIIPSGKLKENTIIWQERAIQKNIKNSILEKTKLCSVNKTLMLKFYNDMKKNDKTSSVIKLTNSLLNKFFNYCVDEDFIQKNPCYRISLPNADGKKINRTPFTLDEIQRIKDVPKDLQTDIIFKLLLGTGLRIGELLALSENDFDFENNTIHITKNLQNGKIITPKTKSSNRIVPVPNLLIKYITQYIKSQKENYLKVGKVYNKSSLIFTTKTFLPIGYPILKYKWELILNKANVEYRAFHTIRHTYSTILLEEKEDLLTIATLLGHTDTKMVEQIYAHVRKERKDEAVSKINYLFAN